MPPGFGSLQVGPVLFSCGTFVACTLSTTIAIPTQQRKVSGGNKVSFAPAEGELAGYFSFLFLCLGVLVMQSRWEWTYKPQYYYGWGVPLLSLYLFFKRWGDRPEPGQRSTCRFGPLLVLVSLLFLWFPLRLLREANMDWRLLHWIIGIGTIGAMLSATWQVGGKPWAVHFAFPITFLLVAITWPSLIEGHWVLFMTRFLVRLATEFLNILGWPAWTAGGIIYLPNASVGMEDACTGIRSFQTAIMVSLFLGELARLTSVARTLLVITAVFLAFTLNLVRTLTLTFLTASGGNALAEKWHDSLGLSILAGTILGLHLICQLLRKRSEPLKITDSPAGTLTMIPLKTVGLMFAWLLLVEGMTELWYRRNDPSEPFKWVELGLPQVDGLKVEPISERVQSTLACTSAQAASWKEAPKTEWWVYTINWARGAGGNVSAYFHNPEVCLPANGLTLVEKQHPFVYEFGGERIEHDVYLFKQGKEPMYVFFGRRLENKVPDKMTMEDRFGRALTGRRLLASQILEVAISGIASRKVAEEKYQRFLQQHISFKAS